MKKIIFLLSLAWSLASQTDARSLVIILSDGTKAYYLINENSTPVMKFVQGEVSVNTDAYTFTGIKKFFISETDNPNAIEAVTGKVASTTMKDGVLYITNGAKTQVFTTDGKLVKSIINNTDGQVSINTTTLPTGTYIIKSGKNSFKFVKH